MKRNRQGTGSEGPDERENIQQLIDDEPVYDETPLPALKRRRTWKRMRWLLWLLLLIPIIYFVVQIFIILAPRMRTDVVMLDSMTDSLLVTGQVVLDSSPVYGSGGHLHYSVPAGQRVTADTEVASVFGSEAAVEAMERLAEVEAELVQLEEAQRTVADGGNLDGLLGEMQGGLYGLMGNLETGNYRELGEARGQVQMAANKIQISTGAVADFEARIQALTSLKKQYERLAVQTGTITASETGYFTPSQQRDQVHVDYEEAEKLTPAQWEKVLTAEPKYYGGDVVGHIVRDYRWYFFTVVDLAQSDKFTEGDKSLRLAFPDAGDVSVPVTVERVERDEEAGVAVVELFSEYISPEILSLRVEEAEIIFGVKKGIRIEKNALRLADFENEDGSLSTFQGVYVKFGNMVYFKRIQILVEDDYYMLVPAEVTDGLNEVELYDEVVMDSGGVELYDRKIL
ncbi:hypothetical protein LJC60_02290 [Ruminococcaceae bacterium OttesenSCG-928-D13]|nr:hypothetical protein [Ruminococcaceae bacterium OttesenSCG-928-D13]